jgi:DNA-binding NtrC family response regulator
MLTDNLLPILLVDDDPVVLEITNTALQSVGVQNVVALNDSRKVQGFLEENQVAMVILDLMMPHCSGQELLPVLTRNHPQVPVIVMTTSSDIDTVVNCMRSGAFDYLTKPVDTGRLLTTVEKALQFNVLNRENTALRDYLLNDHLEHPEAFSSIITVSKKMRAVFQYVEVIARSEQPVLVTGETGVGKELIARALASLSGRKGAFVSVNAAGLDNVNFSDTLFGHKKGAFTGADNVREGLISTAAGGTLFLDEIGDLDESSQIKLLRLIQEGEYYPLGADVIKKSDARILVATHHDLPQLIAAGKFRKDLYYRLCAHKVHIPPLRERREDIPLLLKHILEKAATSLHKPVPVPAAEVVAILSTCSFEGNVRELNAMVYDAVARHSNGLLTLDSFSGLVREEETRPTALQVPFSGDIDEALFGMFGRFPTLREIEDYLINAAMSRTNGNQRSAASLLGIARQTISKRLGGKA